MERSAERVEFLSDVIVTFVEGGPYSWFKAINYRIGPNDTREADLCYDDPDAGDDGDHSKGPIKLDIDLIAKGIARVLDPDFGVNREHRKTIFSASIENDAGQIDINDADVIVQAAVFGSLIYG